MLHGYRDVFLAAILASHSSLAFASDAGPEELSLSTLPTQELPHSGDHVGFGFGSLWIAAGGRLTRIHAASGDTSEIVLAQSGGPCRGVGVGEGAIWVPDCGKGVIYKVDPATNKVVSTISVDMFTYEGSIGVGEGAVWVVTPERGDRTLTRFNAANGEAEATIALPWSATAVLVEHGFIWVMASSKGQLLRIDPRTNALVSSTPLGGTPKGIVAGERSLWVLNEGTGTVQRIDPLTATLIATVKFGQAGPGDITAGEGSVWITRSSPSS